MPCSRAKYASYLLLELAGLTPRRNKQDALLSRQICALFIIGANWRNSAPKKTRCLALAPNLRLICYWFWSAQPLFIISRI